MADFNPSSAAQRMMELEERSQWQRLQDMQNQKRFDAQGAPGVPGMPGAQSGAASPWDEIPGGGSMANATPLPNPMVDDRRGYSQLSEDALINALLGYGVAGASMAAGPTPMSALGAIGGGLYGIGNNAVSSYAADKAKRLGYQGN